MSFTTARPRPRTRTHLLAFASVAVAALALTACQDGQGVRTEGAADQSSARATRSTPSAAPSKTTESAQSGQSTQPAQPVATSKTSSPQGSSTSTSTKTVVCSAANTKVTAQPVKRPLNHMLLTVTNTGSRTCDLYYYPAVRFQDAQSVPPAYQESQPQAVTSLAPGESGYSGIMLAAADGSGSNGYTAKTLQIYFLDRKGDSISPGATPKLPAKGVYLDDSIHVTYWLSDPQDALSY